MPERTRSAAPAADLVHSLFTDAPVALVLVGPDLRILAANHAAAALLGGRPEDLASCLPWHRVPALEPVVRPLIERAMAAEVGGDGARPPVSHVDAEASVSFDAGERRLHVVAQPIVREGEIAGASVMLRDVTAQSIARDHLTALAAAAQETSQALEALVDASPIPIIAYDLEGRLVRWSRAAERTFGWTAAEVLGGPPPSVLEDRRAEYLSQLRETAAGRGLARFETRRRRKDGSVLDALVSTAALRDAAGSVRGTIAVIEDDTERRRSLARAEQLRTLALELASKTDPGEVGTAVLRHAVAAIGALHGVVAMLDGRRLAVVATIGRGGGTGTGRTIELTDEGPLATAARTGIAVVGSRGELRRAQPGLVPTGRGRWGALAALPLQVDGRLVGAIELTFVAPGQVTARDREFLDTVAGSCAQALDRAALFQAVRTAQRTLSEVVAQMPIGVIVADAPSGRLVFGNEAAERIWRGYVPAQSVAEYVGWHGFHGDGRPYEPEEWPIARAVLRGEVTDDEEIEIVRRDGSRTVISMSAGPIRDERGVVRGGVVAFSDIGVRKEAEAIRDAFLGVIGHELRTPVTAIYGGARILLRRERRLDDATRDAVLDDIAAESERLTRLIDNTLVLARSERGREVVSREPLLLQHVLPRVIAAEAPAHPATQFRLRAPSGIPAVLGDEGYVDQVVRNLLSNAAKYGPQNGTVQVVVEPAAGEVRVRVLDDGPGIGDEDPAALFGLFYRSPRTIATASGAGIGLFVVRYLVEAMGGRVWASERAEGGGEFGFALQTLGEADAADD